MTELTGQTIGPYRLVEKLGEGGMAEVYKAYQPKLERYVALKFIRPELAADAGFRSRFEQEAKAIARLSHPNIVHVYDFGEEENLYYLVMEYVHGGTLKDALKSIRFAGEMMDWEEVSHILDQLGQAVDYAHHQGIVHRDVKPGNVMLTADGRAVLNDFGIAKMVGAGGDLTQTGATVGTPAYMSPEQIRGEKEAIGPASDLYSLGVVLYEMLTSRVPFSADTPLAVMYKHLNDPIPLPSTVNPALPEAAEQVILKALAKDPADRYPSGQAMARALRASLSQPPQVARAGAPTRLLAQPRRRARWPIVIAAAMALLALVVCIVLATQAGGILAFLSGQTGEEEAASPTAQTAPATTDAQSTASPSAPTATPTPPPTAAPTSAAEAGTLIAVVQQFAAPGYRAEGITWDGSSLWLSDNSGSLFQLDSSGRLLDAYAAPEVTPMGLAWDGTSFWLFTTNHGRIYQFQIEGQETRTLGSFETPARIFGGNISQELAWDGASLWYANQFNVYQLDTSGTALSSFAFPKNVTGLEWDGENLWLADGDAPSTLHIVDAAGNVLASFPSPIHKVLALARGDDGTMWALGQDAAAADVMVYQLDTSPAQGVLSPVSSASWQAEAEAAYMAPSLNAYSATPAVSEPPHIAAEGMRFLVVDLGLFNPEQGAILSLGDIRATDDEGREFVVAGMELAPGGGFAVGEITGLVHMLALDPPTLDVEFTIEGTTARGGLQTIEGNVPASAPSGAWPTLSLVFLVPEDATGLRLGGDVDEIELPIP